MSLRDATFDFSDVTQDICGAAFSIVAAENFIADAASDFSDAMKIFVASPQVFRTRLDLESRQQ